MQISEGRDRLAQGLEGRDRLAQGLEGRDLREDNAGLADEPLADEPLAAAVAAVLERLIGLFRSLSPASGLSLTAAATLATLERSGPARLTWLAVREGVTQPAMTQLVARLEDAGLAARAADPADGRVVQVRITADGRAMLAGRRAVRAERLAGLLERLSPAEREALSVALPAMDALANAQGGEPVPTAAGVTIGAGR
jgi:DNA-binding MarR family transcriptional regulator